MRPARLSATLALVALLALSAPVASALPPPDYVAIGPDGLADEGTPYYLALRRTALRGPSPAEPGDDCGAKARPRDTTDATKRILAPFMAPLPGPPNSLEPWFPRCVTMTIAHNPCSGRVCPASTASVPVTAYVAWDVPRGIVYVQTAATAPTIFQMPYGMEADCVECPPGFGLLGGGG